MAEKREEQVVGRWRPGEPRLDPPMDAEPLWPDCCPWAQRGGATICAKCERWLVEERSAPAPPTIYRCGWCGHPTDARGDPIRENPEGYLARYPDAHEELVQGDCCPHGNEPEPQMMQVTRDLAIDAGDRNLEGQWIEW